MIMIGKISTFGGEWDSGMALDEGLALYEHAEADTRPDLFFPRSMETRLGTSKRLRPEALYFAYRWDKHANIPRFKLQDTVFRLMNPKERRCVFACLVDWGPHPDTGRMFDISPAAARLLNVRTDDEIAAEQIQ